MKVEFNPLFELELLNILMHIMDESPTASLKFEDELFDHLADLTHFPYKFRKSIYYDDKYIRDYIFMGYTIPYLVDEENGVILVLDIFKWMER